MEENNKELNFGDEKSGCKSSVLKTGLIILLVIIAGVITAAIGRVSPIIWGILGLGIYYLIKYK